MAENWICHKCGSSNATNRTVCLLCNTPRRTPEETAREKDEKTRSTQIALQELIGRGEQIGPRWEYCTLSFSTVTTGQRGLLPFSYQTSEEENAYFKVYGREGIDCRIEQVSEIVAMLGDNGWELVSATQSTSISQVEGVAGFLSNFAMYFKRPKQS